VKKANQGAFRAVCAAGWALVLLLAAHAAHAEEANAAAPRPSEPSPFQLTFGVRALHRSLTFNDTPAQLYPSAGHRELLTYKLPLAPAAFVQANLFPWAVSSRGPEANIGVTGSLELTAPTRSVFAENTPQEQELTSHSTEFFLGLRGRLPLDAHELGLTAGYGEHRYTLSGDEASALVPDVTYQYVRLAADATLHFDELIVGFHLGTRLVHDVGGLRTEFFPNTHTQTVEAGLLLGYDIAPQFQIVGGFDVVRYAFDFNPIPDQANPTFVAGGGVDQYTSGWLGLRFNLANSTPVGR